MLEQYFSRFGWCARQIDAPPPANLGIVVVIPCFNEPSLLAALDSLHDCERPACAVEVIVVVNSSETSPPEILERNRAAILEAKEWVSSNSRWFRTHILDFPALPAKHAGVGLARKIGMDEAARRFGALDRFEGVLLCFDADCRCDPNYLVEVERFFSAHPKCPGASIRFEHPLDSEAIVLYELHLRYYVEALRFAGFPHAYHTIGSSMAVRAAAYVRQGGMNKRKAGEDFYFLHKIIPLGHFSEINSTRVIPSPRASDRVPFGTGRAVRDYLSGEKFSTYPLQAFEDLRELFRQAPGLLNAPPGPLPECVNAFLAESDFLGVLEELRSNTASAATFTKRFFRWFDGFRAMKFIHFARDRFYGSMSTNEAARELAVRKGISSEPSIGGLLDAYRAHQRRHWENEKAPKSELLGAPSIEK